MDLICNIATWLAITESLDRSELAKEGARGMNSRKPLYNRRGPAESKASSLLLPNTRAMLQRMYSRGPAPSTTSSMKSNRRRPTRHTTASSPVLTNPKSVLKKTVTPEELQQPAGPYRKKMLRIESDGLGWGFVVRGTGPCHVQAVEPHGPAAVAGMKVCQLVVAINNQSVLEMDYKAINHLILTGPRKMQMEVMEVTEK